MRNYARVLGIVSSLLVLFSCASLARGATLTYTAGSAVIEWEGKNVELAFSVALPGSFCQPHVSATGPTLTNGTRSITLIPSMAVWEDTGTLRWRVRYTIPDASRVLNTERSNWTLTWTGGAIAADGCGNSTASSGSVSVISNAHTNAAGWTVYDGPWTGTYYCSTSGSDSNSGLTEQAPLRTPMALLAKATEGSSPRLLFKRGDTWVNEDWGTLNVSGISVDRPIYVGSYGTSGARPRFNMGGKQFVRAYRGLSMNKVSWWSIHDIDIRFDPSYNTGGTSGIGGAFRLIANSDGFRIEGCRITGGTGGIHADLDGNVAYLNGIEPWDGSSYTGSRAGVRNLNVYRCAITDSKGSHGQALYFWAAPTPRIVECFLDNNGEVNGNPSNQGHNVYMHSGTFGWKFLRNVSTRSGYLASGGNLPGIIEQSYMGFSGVGAMIRAQGFSGIADSVVEAGRDTYNGTDFTHGGLGINIHEQWADVRNDLPGDLAGQRGPFTAVRVAVVNKAASTVGSEGSFHVQKGNGTPTYISLKDCVSYDWRDNGFMDQDDRDASTHDRIRIEGCVFESTVGGEGKLFSFTGATVPTAALTISGNRYFSDGAAGRWFWRADGTQTISEATWSTYDATAVYQGTAMPDGTRGLARYNSDVLERSGGVTDFYTQAADALNANSLNAAYLGHNVNAWIQAGYMTIPDGGGGGGTPETPDAPPTPGDFYGTVHTSTTASFQWEFAPGATTYTIRQKAGSSVLKAVTVAGTEDSGTITGLTPGSEHTFDLIASNDGGDSAPTTAITWRTSPHQITGVNTTPGAGNVTVAWTASTDGNFESYYVERSTTGSAPWTTVSGALTLNSFVNAGTSGVTYYYRVTQMDTYGLTSDVSSTVTGVPGATTAAPPTPTGLTVRSAKASLAVSWTASPNATSYKVKWGTVSGTYPNSATITAPTTNYTIPSLTNGTTYYVVVSAVSTGGESANSSPKSGRPVRIRTPWGWWTFVPPSGARRAA